ncbi:Plasmid stabilization system protein [Pseudobythopirellula maris]|uniref:Plasmid stabilization system protein n=1 Tax=Pseudobythopirellula maris TaxID=2527991 RepID=A0A5C5ZPJ2_9BACT|nr:type II toxin-antitoxin system RelE/ParE family toxin [Pseudobythopirellula maris]TWT89058.1 Plasmid stabilization system protein [Pseudobythopirellula maris]
MRYRVLLSDELLAGVERHLDYLEQQSGGPGVAARWWEKAVEQVLSLDQMPNRCPLAPENDFEELTIRMLIVDRCLFLFTVDEKESVVRVLKMRHGSQSPRPL